MWKNTVERRRPQMTIWGMRIACCIPPAAHTHTHTHKYVIQLFPYNNGCTNAPQCYDICTLRVLSTPTDRQNFCTMYATTVALHPCHSLHCIHYGSAVCHRWPPVAWRKYQLLHRVIKKFLCTWWLQYRKLKVMFKVSPASLQTFIVDLH
jgi:hypothetical protein